MTQINRAQEDSINQYMKYIGQSASMFISNARSHWDRNHSINPRIHLNQSTNASICIKFNHGSKHPSDRRRDQPINKTRPINQNIFIYYQSIISFPFHFHSHFQCTPRLDPNQSITSHIVWSAEKELSGK